MERSSLRYLLLNPERHFQDVIKQAHSVVLAGGTMHPVWIPSFLLFPSCLFLFFVCLLIELRGFQVKDVVDGLMRNNMTEEEIERRLVTFSCGHIIPDDQLICLALPTGPSGLTLDFTFGNRGNLDLVSLSPSLSLSLCHCGTI